MNKEEFRRHCEKQIERCIKLHDSKHLREHELSLALLNECETRKKEKDNLIKYIENELNVIKIMYLLEETDDDVRRHFLTKKDIFEGLLERIKSDKYD